LVDLYHESLMMGGPWKLTDVAPMAHVTLALCCMQLHGKLRRRWDTQALSPTHWSQRVDQVCVEQGGDAWEKQQQESVKVGM